jgi:response regulator RpfG family c-di-GMP phosphodiesterase
VATILICDDDPEIRAAMKRTLRGHEAVEAGSPAEALALFKEREFDALISDFSMDAESDGLDLLAHVKLVYPNTIRFLVTGNRDIEVASRAINEGSVHRYFSKPWDDAKLRSALEIVLASKHSAGTR